MRGHDSNSEINEAKLLLNNSFVDLKQVARYDDNDNDYYSFEFLYAPIPNGDIKIEVMGYSDWPVGYLAPDDVSIFYDRLPPNIVIISPLYEETIYK